MRLEALVVSQARQAEEIIRNACLRVLEGHTDRVMSVALHADGRRAVTASADQRRGCGTGH